jgi:exodeoxyribonuclease VIII
MSNSIIMDLADADYRALPGISQSALKVIGEQSPAAYRWQRDHPSPPSEAMVMGSLVDCLLLEPDEFDRRYVVEAPGSWPATTCPDPKCAAKPGAPCINRDGSVSKRCHGGRRVEASSDGRRIVADHQHQEASTIARLVLAHPMAGRLIAGTDHQVSMQWTDEATGGPCKGRLDLACVNLLGDLKTCRRGVGSAAGWPRYAWGCGYDYQAAYYSDGWRACTGEAAPPWLWITVETEGPYHCAVHQAHPSWIELGRARYRAALERLLRCQEEERWPGYTEDIQIVSPPRWASVSQEVEQ